MVKKFKKELSIFLVAFGLYFLLGLIYTYGLSIYKYCNVLFDLDTVRVFEDLTIFDVNHYRVAVHPLFIIMFQPMCKILGFIIKENALSCLLIQSAFSAISLVCIYATLKKFDLKNKTVNFLTVLFALSFGQLIFTSNIETYIFAQGLLALLWLFATHKMDKEFKIWDYIILTIFGVCSVGVTLTNVVQFIIVLFFVITMNKKVKNRFVMTFVIGITALSLSVLLACIQNMIWVSAPNYFTKNIMDFINGTSEEELYTTKGFSWAQLLNVINAMFAYSYHVFKLIIPKTGYYLKFNESIISNIFSIVSALIFVGLNAVFIFKTKFNVSKHKIYYALALTLLFNCGLHYFYGNPITFLYICHFNFLPILIVGYIFKELKINILENKIVYYLGLIIIVLLSFRSLYLVYTLLSPKFTVIEYVRLLPVLIILLTLVLACVIYFDKIVYKIVFSVIVIVITLISYLVINHNDNSKNCDVICQNVNSFNEYEKQLKDLKNYFMMETYSDRDEPIGAYFFGMADRTKMVYKKGNLFDAKTGEVIRSFDYEEEYIIPNEYTVILKNNNDIYRITENENGIYLYTNDDVEVLSEGSHINLPEFDGYKYSEVLKVVHQEVLFNIDGSEPKPNIWGYTQAYYRDAMLVSMVLENNNNTDLILDWVNNLTKIYDNSRSLEINEADNLGEMLYIIGATNSNNKELVNKIIKEINRLKDENNHISGLVDGAWQTYYPTSLALFGADKLGIELDLEYPLEDDAYGKLTWYNDYKVVSTLTVDSLYYPYIDWAYYHYSGYGRLYILDEIYPLSYEGGGDYPDYTQTNECFISEYYCDKDLLISHSWSASEMYLLLLNY